VRIYERNNSADNKSSEEGGGEGGPGAGEQIPLQPMVSQAVPLQPMEVHNGTDIHLQPVKDPTPEQVDARRRLSPDAEPVLEQDLGRTCGPVEREEPMLDICWQDL